MPLLPFDRNDPPCQPPESCDNALRWAIAYQLLGLAAFSLPESVNGAAKAGSRPTPEDER